MNMLVDKKVNCISILSNIKIKEFISLVEEAYKNRGGILGQRNALKQKTAIVIRNRMIEDIKAGAVLPPIVLGLAASTNTLLQFSNKTLNIEEYIEGTEGENISIIDGMQRTTAILEAIEDNSDVLEQEVRVEYWIADNSNSLLYRMLVLNTGQVPWNTKRQIEVIFNGIIKEIEAKIDGIDILKLNDKARRTKAGQYQASDLIELFLAFGTRSWKVDTKEKLTDEFTRLDFIQSSGETDLVNLFCEVLKYLYEFDKALDIGNLENAEGRFKEGKDLFKTQTARIGFITSIGEKILGRPGMDKNKQKIDSGTLKIKKAMEKVLSKISSYEQSQLKEYLDFDTLNQRMDKKTGKVGAYERELFYSGFKVLFEEEGDLDSLGPCWRAL